MASWRGHLQFGIWSGGVLALFAGAFLSLAWIYAPVVFIVVVLGAFLSDLDSDTSCFIIYLFCVVVIFSVVGVGYVLYYCGVDLLWVFGLGFLCVVVLLYSIVFTVFKRLTHHRGIFHSIPAIFIVSLAFLSLFRWLLLFDGPALVLAGSVGFGYTSHLVLDTLWSNRTLSGVLFKRRRGSGPALKFLFKHVGVNLFTYGFLAALFHLNVDVLMSGLPIAL